MTAATAPRRRSPNRNRKLEQVGLNAELVQEWALLELAKTCFPAFLHYVRIQDALQKGDSKDGSIEFELWPHLERRAWSWDIGTDEVILKARQLGLSWLAAAYALFRGMQPSANVLLLSMGEREAFELLGKVDFIWQRLPAELKRHKTVDNIGELAFENGGAIAALPSTKQAGRGFTATLVIVDEAAFHPWAQQNYAAYRATIADGGQLLILSTGNGVGGFFFDQYHKGVRSERTLEAIAAGTASEEMAHPLVVEALRRQAKPVFIPWSARPDRDELWYEIERQAYIGMEAEFRAEYPATPEEAFVRLTGLVFPQFSAERHVRDEEPVPWERCHARYAAYDLGGGDPTAIVTLGVYRDRQGFIRVHQYGQYYRTNGAPDIGEMANFLLAWHEAAPFAIIEGDPKDEVVISSIRKYGLPIETADWARGKGLGIYATFLDNDWLTIGSHCKESIYEHEGYRWLTRVDPNAGDRYATATPVDHHGDTIDSRRLALVRIFTDYFSDTNREESPLAFSEVQY